MFGGIKYKLLLLLDSHSFLRLIASESCSLFTGQLTFHPRDDGQLGEGLLMAEGPQVLNDHLGCLL